MMKFREINNYEFCNYKKCIIVPVKTKRWRKKKKLRHIRVFDCRIKRTVILTSVKNTKTTPRKKNLPFSFDQHNINVFLSKIVQLKCSFVKICADNEGISQIENDN